ncbi:MAG: ABC transporter permease [Spirochaetales bacterium]|jgi:ABC-type dipeptide/oligopeptide/nickel transport system permease subunit|nr:ABC transporter permease [Spirochaetales bacterium]
MNKQIRKDSLWRDAFRRLLKNKIAVVGGVFIILLALTAIFAPVIAPYHYGDGDFDKTYAPPGKDFLLGADFLGRDMLSRLIYGSRISLMVGTFGALFAFTIGILYGTISGFVGGKTDNIMMRIVDVLYAFPGLLFIILLMVTFKSGFTGEALQNPFVRFIAALDKRMGGMLFIMIGISLTSWVGMARLSRGMALSLRETEFIQAAQALGARNLRIVVRHLVPNLVGPMLVRVTLAIPGYISTEAFLSFIGLGVDPPTPSWGMMIAEGFKAMRSHPHLALFPGIALALVMLSFNFLGDGLRDALDPRMKQ